MLLAPDLREWLPEDHAVHFIVETVEHLPLQGFQLNVRGTGSAQYPPAMMLSLSIYCYATGRMGSRQIEAATYTDVAVRYICGGEHHPDHDTICAFRRENGPLFSESFVKVLAYAQELGVLVLHPLTPNAEKTMALYSDSHGTFSFISVSPCLRESPLL
jgi:transposase